MSNPLNYLRPKDQGTIAWNKKLNREDIIHDSPGLNNRDKAKQNLLFRNCLDTFAPPSAGKADYIESDYVCVLPFKESKGVKPAQLAHISESIPDTYPGEKIGLPDRISPSYFFDPASRKYTEKVKQGAKTVTIYKLDKLRTFLTSNGSSIIDADKMKNYGIDELSFEASITADGKLTFNFSSPNTNIGSFTIKVDKEGFAEYAGTPPYIAGNAEKKKYFDDNKSDKTPAKKMDGTRYILCKLLGDLSHVLYSDDSTIVFTNDTYLRDRCIKNKTATVCREFLGKNYMTGGVVERKPRKPVAKKIKDVKTQASSKTGKKEKEPVKVKKVDMANKTSVYKLYDIAREDIIRGGAAMVNSEYIDPANKCNVDNLLSEIDAYNSRIDQFLTTSKFRIGAEDIVCSDQAVAYLTTLKGFLSGTVKAEINNLDVNKSVEEFNIDLMKWFPLQIIFHSEDMSTKVHPWTQEKPGFYSPKNIAKVFPKLEDKIGEFQNKIPEGIFQNNASSPSSGSLNGFLTFFENEFSELRNGEELDNAKTLLELSKTNTNLLSESENFINLIDAAIDLGVIDEYDVLIEYLRDICKYDDVYANTCYTVLRPMVYFNGYNIYDYNILTKFVEKIKSDGLKYADKYSSFDKFLMENMKDDVDVLDEDGEDDVEIVDEREQEKITEDHEESIDEQKSEKPTVFDFRKLANEPERIGSSISRQSMVVHGGSRKTLKKRRTKRATKKSKKNTKRRTRKH